MKINIVVRDYGWLLNDLARHGVRVGAESDHDVFSSERPNPASDCWIFHRSAEAAEWPDLSRSLVVIHDLLCSGQFTYDPGSVRRKAICGAGALMYTHGAQRRLIDDLVPASERIAGQVEKVMPIGALECFKPRQSEDRQDVFTVGFSGKTFIWEGHDLKRLDLFVDAIKILGPPVRVILIGEGLEEYASQIRETGAEVPQIIKLDHASMSLIARSGSGNWEDYAPALYRQMSAFVATSESPAVPLGCYEALASGVPVVSTPREWPGDSGRWVAKLGRRIAESQTTAEMLAEELREIRANQWTDQAGKIAESMPWTLESWCRENTGLASGLVR